MVDQSPIGRTTRSNPASYVGAFDAIRALFAAEPLAKQRGYTAGTFSFNAGNGRCPTCGGNGFEHVEMQFLSDVYLRCPDCNGRRFRAEVLEVTLAGKERGQALSVADVLELTVAEALAFFSDHAQVQAVLIAIGRRRPGIPQARPAGAHALGRRGAAAEARRASGRGEQGLARRRRPGAQGKTVPVRRAHHRPALRRYREAAARVAQAHRHRTFRGGDRTQSRRDPRLRLDHRSRPGRRRCGRRDRVHRHAGGSQGACRLAYRKSAAGIRRRARSIGRRAAPVGRFRGVAAAEIVAGQAQGRSSHIRIHNAREHNLQNVDVEIPRNQFTVVTGVSGSGKSTLAFDILFAEGQRRYLESLNAYARQFVQPSSRPDVDAIFGIPPTVAIEQRTSRGGRKSTVATLTEIYHFLRLLYVKLGTQYCPDCNVAIEPQSFDAIAARILRDYRGPAHRPARAAGRQPQGLLHRSRQMGEGQGLRLPARRRRVPAHGEMAAPRPLSRAHHRAAGGRPARHAGERGGVARGACARARLRQGHRARPRRPGSPGRSCGKIQGPSRRAGIAASDFLDQARLPVLRAQLSGTRSAPVFLQLQAWLVRQLPRHRRENFRLPGTGLRERQGCEPRAGGPAPRQLPRRAGGRR